jgi:hypothetical protein
MRGEPRRIREQITEEYLEARARRFVGRMDEFRITRCQIARDPCKPLRASHRREKLLIEARAALSLMNEAHILRRVQGVAHNGARSHVFLRRRFD